MYVSPLLLAAFVIATPLTLLTVSFMLGGFDWQTYRVSIDVARPESERPAADEASELAITPTDAEASAPHIRGPGGVRGWLRRHLYTYYRRR